MALLVFLVGFIIFLRDLSQPVALPNLILIVVGATLLVLSVLAALWDPFCPFQAPLTGVTRSILHNALQKVSDGASKLCERREWYGARGWWTEMGRSVKNLGHMEVDDLEAHSVRRVFENSTNNKLLFSTAANIPLLNGDQLKSLFSPPNSLCNKLIELYYSADEGTPEEEVYCRAVAEVYLEDFPTGRDPNVIIFDLCTQRHLRTVEEPISSITSSLACVAASYLAAPDPSPEAHKKLSFLKETIAFPRVRVRTDAHSALGMVAWTILVRSQRKKMLQQEPWPEDLKTTLFIETFDDTEQEISAWRPSTVLAMTKAAYRTVW